MYTVSSKQEPHTFSDSFNIHAIPDFSNVFSKERSFFLISLSGRILREKLERTDLCGIVPH